MFECFRNYRWRLVCGGSLIVLAFFSGCDSGRHESNEQKTTSVVDAATSLFDGKTLSPWKPTNFGGEGDITVVDGELKMEMGYPMTGVTWDGFEIPKQNYEISLEARRDDGVDFFCGLTFPVKESHCSLIVGGWGGTLLGLSCIDGFDASENATTQFLEFDDNRWYKIRVKVSESTITVWLDDKEVVHQQLEGHEISLRNETLPCRPLGICCFETVCRYRNVKLTRYMAESSDAEKK